MPDADLVVIRTYVNNFEAEVDRTALEAAGIDALIRRDDCGGMRPHLWLSGIELIVRAEDAGRAREILATPPVDAGDGDPGAEGSPDA